MKMYEIHVREEGRGKPEKRKFSSLVKAQEYIKERWQGVEYMDCNEGFHTDYCTFDLIGFTLKELGKRTGPPGTDEFWDWQWFDLNAPAPSAPKEDQPVEPQGLGIDEDDVPF